MLIWIAMLVPVATAAILFFFFEHKTVWWEFLVPFVLSAVLILLCKCTAEKIGVTDTEYWGNKGVVAEHYEDWDEKVPCRHPKYCTRTVSRTDSKGRTHTSTERYQCGYEHMYDVDYHPECWVLKDDRGKPWSISRGQFERLASKWGNKTFVDLHRDYHSDDGDMYQSKWDGRDETIEPVISKHFYENRVQAASDSLFNFQEVPEEDEETYGLFDYPDIEAAWCPSILGDGPRKAAADDYLTRMNAKLGAPKQVRMWILVYKNQPMEAAFLQRNLWKGGNKNEFTVCVGTNDAWDVTWCKVISWTEVETLKAQVEGDVAEMGKLDLEKIAALTVDAVQKDFVRKEFADFSYITVEPPWWAVVLTILLVAAANAGISAFLVMNEFKEKRRCEEETDTRHLFDDLIV